MLEERNVFDLYDRGEYDQALEYISEHYSDEKSWKIMVIEIEMLRLIGKLDLCLSKIKKIIENHNLDKDQQFEMDILRIYCYWAKLEHEKGIVEIYKLKNKVLDDKLNISISNQAKFYHVQGILEVEIGQYENSLINFEKAKALYSELGITKRVSLILNNIGFTLALLGKTDQAEINLINSLNLLEENSDAIDRARIYNNLGIAKIQQEKLKDAKNYFLKGLEIQRSENNLLELSYSLFEIICLTITTENENTIWLLELQNLAEKTNEMIVTIRYKLAKAMSLSRISRFEAKVEAVKLFQELLDNQQTPKRYSFLALKNLAEIKLEELNTYGDMLILDEIDQLIKKQYQTASNPSSILEKIEADIIISKLELIKGNFDKSTEMIKICLETARENNITHMINILAGYTDQLDAQLQYWEQTIPNWTRNELLEKSEIFTFLRNAQYGNLGYISLQKEEPLIFMVIAQSGAVLLNLKNKEEDETNEFMIGTFLSAINAFFNEVFISGNNIEKVTSNDYSILLKPEVDLTYCYIYRGQSYFAKQKLHRMVLELKLMKSYQDYLIGRGRAKSQTVILQGPEINSLARVMNS